MSSPPSPAPDAQLERSFPADELAQLTHAGCRLGLLPEEPPVQVRAGGVVSQLTTPPLSGAHYPTWAPYGVYDEPVPDGYLVHNLRRGAIVIWADPELTRAQREALQQLVGQLPKGILTPASSEVTLGGIIVGSWARAMHCSASALRTLGPQGITKNVLALDAALEQLPRRAPDADSPAWPGAMKEPIPTIDTSVEPPST